MNPRVTIGIPFRNAERTLTDAVRSVFAQELSEWELVLVDDGSTDASLRIARSIRDPRVTVRSDGEPRGLVARLNEIARIATAPLIARMDADDLMHPQRLARQVALLDARPDVQVVGAATYTIDADGRLLGWWGGGPLPRTTADLLERGFLFVHPSVVFRTVFAREHPYEEAYVRAEDLALWCRIVEHATCATDDEPLLFYRLPIPISIENYARTQRSKRAILREFGACLAPSQRARLLLRTYWSTAAYRVAGALGAQRLLVSSRARPLDPDRRRSAERALSAIRAVRVRGIDETRA